MAYDAPDLTRFKERFPEFVSLGDDLVQAVLNEATAEVSLDIVERDYAPAIMFLAAYTLIVEGHAARAVIEGGVGNGPVKAKTIEGVKIEYALADFATGAAERLAQSAAMYLERYRAILRRNFGGPVVV